MSLFYLILDFKCGPQIFLNLSWSLTEPLKSYLPTRKLFFQSSILGGYVSSRVCKPCGILIYISLSGLTSSHRFGSRHKAGCDHFFYLSALSSRIFKGIVWGHSFDHIPSLCPRKYGRLRHWFLQPSRDLFGGYRLFFFRHFRPDF